MSEEKQWVVEDLTREKIWAAADLQKSYYGEDNDTADPVYLEYDYFDNPDGPTLGALAWNEARQEAGGGYALKTSLTKIGDRVEHCFNSVNSLTRSTYQGQGVYVTVARHVFQRAVDGGYYMTYGMPNQNAYPIQMKKGLFEDIGPVPLFLRPLRPSGMARAYLHSGFLGALARPFDGLFRPRAEEGDFVRLTDENLELADRFWEAIKDKYPIMVVRNSRRLAFRFLHIPRRRYECWYALDKGEPVAMVIGRDMDVAGIHCAMIGDFLYLEGHEAQAKALVRKVMGILREQGGDMAGCMMLLHTGERRLLKQMGFFRCPKKLEPQPFPLCVHGFHGQRPGAPDFMELGNWFFTMCDYDII